MGILDPRPQKPFYNMFAKLKRGARRLFSPVNDPWPFPPHAVESSPHFLFILTPPNSGSTALAQTLLTVPGSALLHPKGEGQWLVPGMCVEARWDPSHRVEWSSVRAVWLARVQFLRSLVHRVDLVIEKSPPHLVRFDQLVDTFPASSTLAFNRHPFGQCASALGHSLEGGSLTPAQRIEEVRRIAGKWVDRSNWIRRWVLETGAPYLSYERLCASPAESLGRLSERLQALSGVHARPDLRVKSYATQPLRNHNARQIASLSAEELEIAAEVLGRDPDLLDFFGFDLEDREGSTGGARL